MGANAEYPGIILNGVSWRLLRASNADSGRVAFALQHYPGEGYELWLLPEAGEAITDKVLREATCNTGEELLSIVSGRGSNDQTVALLLKRRIRAWLWPPIPGTPTPPLEWFYQLERKPAGLVLTITVATPRLMGYLQAAHHCETSRGHYVR